MLLFAWFLAEVVGYERQLPFIPILISTNLDGKEILESYFNFRHLKRESHESTILIRSIEELKEGKDINRNKERIKTLASSGNPHASFTMGVINELGLFGQPIDDELARSYFQMGADREHPESLYALSFYLRYGIGGPQNIPQSIVLMTVAATKGSVRAKIASSFHKRFGIYMPKSCFHSERVMSDILELTTQNMSFIQHQYKPGVSRLFKGRYPEYKESREKEELEIINQVKETGKPDEKLTLARQILHFARPNLTLIQELLEPITDISEAKCTLARLKYEVLGQEPDVEFLLGNLDLENQNRHPLCLSTFYRYVLLYTQQKEYLPLIERASSTGTAEIEYVAGLKYLIGGGPVEQDIKKAVKLFAAAERQQFIPAMFELSKVMYGEGDACEEVLRRHFLVAELSMLFQDASVAFDAVGFGDLQYALRIYQYMADQGSEAAMWNSQRLLEDFGGNGSQWFDLQVSMGFHTALYELGERTDEEEKKIELWKKTASKEYKSAFRLGWYYRTQRPLEAYMNFVQSKALYWPVTWASNLAIVFVLIINFPAFLKEMVGRHGEAIDLYTNFIYYHSREMAMVLVLSWLLVFIRIRVSMFIDKR